jgi:ABC-2 type transport system permease protein
MSSAAIIAMMSVRQTLGLRRAIGFGILALAPAVIFVLVLAAPSRIDELELMTGFLLFPHLTITTPIITLILAASTLGDERRDQTLSFLVLRPVRRETIAAAKLAGAFLAASALTGAGGMALGVVYGVTSSDWSLVVPTVVGTVVATAVYCAVFVPLGYITDRSTVIGLAFVFVWENGMAAAVQSLATTSPWRIGFSALSGMAPKVLSGGDIRDFALGDLMPGAGGALVRAAVFLLLATAVISAMLRRRDLA